MIEIELDTHPPSSNTIWKKGRGNQMYLSAEAKQFREMFKAEATRQLTPKQFMDVAEHEGTFVIEVILEFESLKTKTTGRYKRVDVSNRVKFVEDCLAKALDIDDSRNQGQMAWKVVSDRAPRTVVRYWPMGVDDGPRKTKYHGARDSVSQSGIQEGPQRTGEGPTNQNSRRRRRKRSGDSSGGAPSEDETVPGRVRGLDQDTASVRHGLPQLSGRCGGRMLEDEQPPVPEKKIMALTTAEIQSTPDDKLRALLMKQEHLEQIGKGVKEVLALPTDKLKGLYLESLGDEGPPKASKKAAVKKAAAKKSNGKKAAVKKASGEDTVEAGIIAIAETIGEMNDKLDAVIQAVDDIQTTQESLKFGLLSHHALVGEPFESFESLAALTAPSGDDEEEEE